MANSNVSEILKIQTFTTFHFWKLWWLKNDQNASLESLDILGGYFRVKHDSKMTSRLLETLKVKIKSGGKLFNDLWIPKFLMKKVRTRLKQNIQKKLYLKHSSYVLPFRKILKHSTIADLFKTAWIKTLYYSSYFLEAWPREF